MLEVTDLQSGYGDVDVLHKISLSVPSGKIVALLGANGAGKTTLMRTISGLLRAKGGQIILGGKRIDDLPAEKIVALGLSHVPQGRGIFPGLTVHENLLVARTAATAIDGGFESARELVYKLFPKLEERKQQMGWSLSGGEQQMLAVSRALIARAKVVILDEPSLGLAPLIYRAMFDAIQTVRDSEGLTVLMVEQNAIEAMRISDYVYVMQLGSIVAHGPSKEMQQNEELKRAYIG